MKAINECLFCTSRTCRASVFSLDKEYPYDEIACINHIKELHAHSDQAVPGVLRRFISGSIQKRARYIEVSLIIR